MRKRNTDRKNKIRVKVFKTSLSVFLAVYLVVGLYVCHTLTEQTVISTTDSVLVSVQEGSTDRILDEESVGNDSSSSAKDAIQMLVEETLSTNSRETLPLPPEPTLGAFIHIGKTGGSTIQQLLRNGCSYSKQKPCISFESWPESKENAISKLTTYYHTNELDLRFKSDEKRGHYKFFVITMRDPLPRAVSAYLFSHPTNRAYYGLMHIFPERKRDGILKKENHNMEKALEHVLPNPSYVHQDSVAMYKCFPTIESYAQKLRDFDDYKWTEWKDDQASEDCASVAKATIHRTFHQRKPWQAMGHQFYDLRSSLRLISGMKDRTILAVRKEFLWQDWVSAHRWLGEKGEIFTADVVMNNSTDVDYPVKSDGLSESGRKNLCLALKEEYRLYLRLLVISANLSHEEVQRSLEIAKANCPWLNLRLPGIDEVQNFEKDEGLKDHNVEPIWAV